MNTLSRRLWLVITLLVMTGIMCIAGAQEIILPPAAGAPDVLGYARIKDISAFLDTIDSWASQVNPMMPAGATKMTAGQYLGDPTMADFDKTRSMSLAVLNPKTFVNPLILFLPVTNHEKIVQSIQAKGSFTVFVPGDKMLIIADDQISATKGSEIWPQIKTTLSGPMDGDMLIQADMEKIITLYGADLKQKIKDFQGQMLAAQPQAGTPEKIKQMEAQTAALFEMAEQIKTMATRIDAKKEGLTLSLFSEAKPGTDLAGLFTPKKMVKPSLHQYMPQGAIKVAFAGDPEVINEFGTKMTNSMFSKTPPTDLQKVEAVKKFQALQKETLDDEMAGSFLVSGVPGINGALIYKVKDEAKALEMIRKSKEQTELASDPAQGLTVTADLKENVRQAEGVNVHSMTITFAATDPNVTQALMMFFPGGKVNVEMAIVNKHLIYGMNIPVDSMVKAIKTQTGTGTMTALGAYPADGQFYGDMDVLQTAKGLLSGVMGPMLAMMGQQNPLAAIDQIKAPPVTFYARSGNAKMAARLDISMETVLKVKQAMEKVQGAMQGGTGAPINQ